MNVSIVNGDSFKHSQLEINVSIGRYQDLQDPPSFHSSITVS